MPIDPTLVGRTYPPTPPYAVTHEAVRAFATALDPDTGGTGDGEVAVPATFPIVLAFGAMNTFLAAEDVELSRIVHGEQKFSYRRPVAVGDVLVASLTVAGLRQIGGNDIIATTSAVTDADGEVVCETTSTLVHRGGAA